MDTMSVFETVLERISKKPQVFATEDFELCLQRTQSAQVGFKNGQRVSQNQNEQWWLSLRVQLRASPGMAVTTLTTEESVDQLVENAFASAKWSESDPYFRFPSWKNTLGKPVTEIEAQALPASVWEKLSNREIFFEEKYQSGFSEVHLFRKKEKKFLSYGTPSFKTHFKAAVPNQALGFHEFVQWASVFNPRSADRAFETVHEATSQSLLENPKVPKVDTWLFSPLANARILKETIDFFCADQVQTHKSFLAEVLEKTKISPAVSLVDDATLMKGPWSRPFDLEGVPSQKTVLIEKGKLTSLLYDCASGLRDNHLSSANRVRLAEETYPKVYASNFYLEPGQYSSKDLRSQIRQGIWLTSVHSVKIHQEHPGNLEIHGAGWYIDNGETAYPLREISFNLSLEKYFRHINAVANDLEFFEHSGSPSVLLQFLP